MRWLKSDIAVFLYKVVGIYILWYLVYELWLLPDGRLDAWVCRNVAQICYDFLEVFGYDAFINGRLVGINGTTGIRLIDGCSGISPIGLFIGFVVAYPGRWVPRICFIVIGIGIIYLVNIIRNVTLAITLAEWPGIFDFMHTYSTTAIFYLVIFGLWMIWANVGSKKQAAADSIRPTAAV